MTRRTSGSERSRHVSADENKMISWRLQEEVFGQGKLELVDELLAPDYVSHSPGDPELRRGPEDIKEIVRAYHSAFPDITYTMEKQVCEGDMVVTRWLVRGTHRGELMGVAPSGRRIEVSGMSMDRISGGKIVPDIPTRKSSPKIPRTQKAPTITPAANPSAPVTARVTILRPSPKARQSDPPTTDPPIAPSRSVYVSPQVMDIMGYTPEECTSTLAYWTKILRPVVPGLLWLGRGLELGGYDLSLPLNG